ncbi:adenosylcobinamide-GDP ribazoletransferase [Bacillus sp. FJAT-45350]|uniref:adenosylcobinamide-GDP ribazoletransferase n=1 Tax=Bacillus sp. FJAT-45350 TaxID=2011014 RepID=UPI000BB79E86|nr:adenosylcobinamide-GDP ribazoletransferase [Bacillus sp. FJAT-45350]
MSIKERASILLDGITLAFQFLTVLPLKREAQWDDIRGKMSVHMYPLTGLFLGALLAIQAYALVEFSPFSTLMIAFWLLFFSVVYSGGLHLDGWMDVSDACLSHRDKERKLEILKDSRVGAFAVLSVIFLLSWRFLLIYEAVNLAGSHVWIFFFLLPFLSRWFIGINLYFGNLARKEGMGFVVKQMTGTSTLLSHMVWITSIFLLIIVFNQSVILSFFLLIVIGLLAIFISHNFYTYHFGGITGDTIGAHVEGSETILWLTVWLLLSFGMV